MLILFLVQLGLKSYSPHSRDIPLKKKMKLIEKFVQIYLNPLLDLFFYKILNEICEIDKKIAISAL